MQVGDAEKYTVSRHGWMASGSFGSVRLESIIKAAGDEAASKRGPRTVQSAVAHSARTKRVNMKLTERCVRPGFCCVAALVECHSSS